jgi:hypothetical protein
MKPFYESVLAAGLFFIKIIPNVVATAILYFNERHFHECATGIGSGGNSSK